MHDLVQEWLAKAEEDWDSAKVLLRDVSPLVTPALFHMQQCAEKLLKALLIKKKVYFERRHDLSYLLRLADEPELLSHSRLLNELNPFAVEIRYPGDLPQFSINEASVLLENLRSFRVTILPLINHGSS
jgi:HEPN domain-containing protein